MWQSWAISRVDTSSAYSSWHACCRKVCCICSRHVLDSWVRACWSPLRSLSSSCLTWSRHSSCHGWTWVLSWPLYWPWRLSSKHWTAVTSARTNSSDSEQLRVMNACASWPTICHLLWKVSIAKASFLSMVCISRWVCCWWFALTISVRTVCWRFPAMLPACTDSHWTNWLPYMRCWGIWQVCATGLDGGYATCSTWPAGYMSLRWLITCQAGRGPEGDLCNAMAVTEPWQSSCLCHASRCSSFSAVAGAWAHMVVGNLVVTSAMLEGLAVAMHICMTKTAKTGIWGRYLV